MPNLAKLTEGFIGATGAGGVAGALGAGAARDKLRDAGLSEREIDYTLTREGGAARGALKQGLGGVLGGAAGYLLGSKGNLAQKVMALNAGSLLGMGTGTYMGYQDELGRADEALDSLQKQSSVKQAYIMGMHQAFIDSGRLVQLPLEKMAQAAQIADAATPEEVQLVGSQITSQDISSLAKILGVLTELQQKFLEGGMGAPPMGPPPMDPAMMGPPPMGPPPMGPPPMGPPPMGPPPGAMPPPM